MAIKLKTFQCKVTTSANKERICLFQTVNYMEAMNRILNQGFLVTNEGTYIPSSSISEYSLKELEEGDSSYEDFKLRNQDMLRQLRLL